MLDRAQTMAHLQGMMAAVHGLCKQWRYMARTAAFFGLCSLEESRLWTPDDCLEGYVATLEGLGALKGALFGGESAT